MITITALVLAMADAASEVHTWVDKQGKRHYGDTVPPEYAENASAVEVQEPNLIDPEPSVERINRRYRAELNYRYENRRRAQEQAQQEASARETSTAAPAPSPERCWKEYPHGSQQKARTQCLKSLE